MGAGAGRGGARGAGARGGGGGEWRGVALVALGVWAVGTLALSRRGAAPVPAAARWTRSVPGVAGARSEGFSRKVDPTGTHGTGGEASAMAAAQHHSGANVRPGQSGGGGAWGLGEHVVRTGPPRAGRADRAVDASLEWLAPVGDTMRAEEIRARSLGEGGGGGRGSSSAASSPEIESRRAAVKRAMQHAWDGYERHAWGHDELDTIKLRGTDDFSALGATIVDSLDTLWIMGMREEFDRAADWVETELNFEPDVGKTSFFETNIRIVGGLLGAYYLSGDRMFLGRAKELADRLLPAFDNGPMVLAFDNNIDITTGRHDGSRKILAHWGTIQMEFLALSRETGDRKYWDLANSPIEALWDDDKETGLLPTYYNPGWKDRLAHQDKEEPPSRLNLDASSPPNGADKPHNNKRQSSNVGEFPGDYFTMGGEADSYYEYLLKTWLLAGGSEDLAHFRGLYDNSVDMMDTLLVVRPKKKKTGSGRKKRHTFLGTAHVFLISDDLDEDQKESYRRPRPPGKGGRPSIHLPYDSSSPRNFLPHMQHLDCFVPGMLVLGAPHSNRPERDLQLAADLTETCNAMYDTPSGLAPDTTYFNTTTGKRVATHDGFNLLRPEAVEAIFYLWRSTGDPKYRDWGWEIFQAFERNSRMPDGGYAGLRNVSRTNQLGNHKYKMESFFLAETLKYLYLLFSPDDVMPLHEWVFNTEAHPFMTSPQPRGGPPEPQPFKLTQKRLWESIRGTAPSRAERLVE